MPDAAYCERFVGVPEQLRDLGVANPTRERPRGLALTDNEEDSEDEVDENEELWRTQDALDGFGHLESSNWAQRLHEVLGADGARWAATKARLGVVACNAGVGPAAAIALGELLPHSAVDLCVAEASEAAASLAVRAATNKARLTTRWGAVDVNPQWHLICHMTAGNGGEVVWGKPIKQLTN